MVACEVQYVVTQDPSGGALDLGELPVILGQGGSLKMMEEDQVVPVTSGREQDQIEGNGQGELRRRLQRASPRGLQSSGFGVRQEVQMARQHSAQLPQVDGPLSLAITVVLQQFFLSEKIQPPY